MFQIFKDKELLFQETTLAMSLADGQQTTGGEATNSLEHHINTRKIPPISVPPYRMSPVKKEILRKEIEDLLKKDIIEECESPYGAPVVLIPKPNNQFRLCINYRKLNEAMVPDTYHFHEWMIYCRRQNILHTSPQLT
ncbi:retrovirus-related Pol polyprotein from transposon 297 [Trichonephila clavipes]|nr:retrovirus-related Pol polyprotein from transposon 297 [Trichonephila clavipes]